MSYLAEAESHCALTPLQAGSCTYRSHWGRTQGKKY